MGDSHVGNRQHWVSYGVAACKDRRNPGDVYAGTRSAGIAAARFVVWRGDYARIGRTRTEDCLTNVPDSHSKGAAINLNLTIGPLVALIAGILILVIPRLLNYIVALYLIVIGLLGLFGGNFNLK